MVVVVNITRPDPCPSCGVQLLVDESDLVSGEVFLDALDLPNVNSVFALSVHPTSTGDFAWIRVKNQATSIPRVKDEVHVFGEEGAPPQRDGLMNLLSDFWIRAKEMKLLELKGHVKLEVWDALNKMGLPVPCRKGLYIRECFHDFYESVIVAAQSHVFVNITGTSGIGKSAFLWYVILRMAISGLVVQLVFGEKGNNCHVLVFRRDGSVGYHSSFPRFSSLKLPDYEQVIQLVDQRYIGNHLKTVIIFASPAAKNTKQVTKGGGGKRCTRILPSWRGCTSEFIELCKAEGVEDFERVIQRWGMIPRMVLDDGSVKDVDVQVVEACDLEYANFLVGKKVLVKGEKVTCKMFEMVPDSSYQTCSIRFASRHIAKLFFNTYWAKKRKQLITFLKASAGMADFAVLRGFMFENYVLSALVEQGQVLHARSIGDAPIAARPDYFPPTFKVDSMRGRTIKEFNNLEEVLAEIVKGADMTKYVWRPKKCNPVYGAIAFPWILQLTVAHPDTGHLVIEQELVNTVARLFSSTKQLLSFLVVVPSEDADGWNAKSLHWKKAKGKDNRTCHSRALQYIGRYCTGFDFDNMEVKRGESSFNDELQRHQEEDDLSEIASAMVEENMGEVTETMEGLECWDLDDI